MSVCQRVNHASIHLKRAVVIHDTMTSRWHSRLTPGAQPTHHRRLWPVFWLNSTWKKLEEFSQNGWCGRSVDDVDDLVFSCFLHGFLLGFWQMSHIPNFPKKFDGTWLQQGHELIYIYMYIIYNYIYIIIYRSLRFYGPFGIRGSTLFRENGTRPRRSGCRLSMMWLRSLVKISQGVWWSKAW